MLVSIGGRPYGKRNRGKESIQAVPVGDEVVHALDGVSFEIPRGEFCAIVGTSGSGKSTLLNMLAGLEKPTKGKIRIAGHQIEGFSEDRLVLFAGSMWDLFFRPFICSGQ